MFLREKPFATIELKDGLKCPCCEEAFDDESLVIQVKCCATNCYHKKCLKEYYDPLYCPCKICSKCLNFDLTPE